MDMDQRDVSPQVALQRLLNGYRVTQIIAVAARLGLADLLAERPMTAQELANAVGAHPDALARMLRALVSVGVFAEVDAILDTGREQRRFGLTPIGELLRQAHPDSTRAQALFLGEDAYRAWAEFGYSVRTGQPAFDKVFGAPHFAYLAEHPEESAIFNQTMSAGSRRAAAAVVAAYDFAPAQTVMDVGGGQGMLLAAILQAHPMLRGVLFDMPGVVASAEPTLRAAGALERCTLIGGDFFAPIPASADIITMRQVLHDWDDAQCALILRNCASALTPHGRVLVVEIVTDTGVAASQFAFLDLQMLVMNGGHERTRAEFERIFNAAGLRVTRVIPTQVAASLIEAEPVA